MTKILFTGDIHVAEGLRNTYRWAAFDDLAKEAIAYGADLIVVAGDLTDKKDGHSASLVNQTVAEFRKMPVPVIILMGNHDYIDPTEPFFGFLQEDWCRFVIEPEILDVDGTKLLLLPHTRTPDRDWQVWRDVEVDIVVAHQTFHGASTGIQTLKGISSNWFSENMEQMPAVVLSGDVHPPQVVGDVTYIGAPHPVNFGEDHKYRFLLVDSNEETIGVRSLWRDTVQLATRRVEVDGAIPSAFEGLRAGDLVKIVVELESADMGFWDDIRAQIQQYGVENDIYVHGVRAQVTDVKSQALGDHIPVEDHETPEETLDLYGSGIYMDEAMLDVGIALFHGRL